MAVASPALEPRLRAGLEELAAPFPESAPASLADLAVLVAVWGQRINLTGHRTPELVADRLILDAAALAAALPLFDSIVDLGSGAGFPGLPIAILYPAAQVFLVEARQRRHHFQRAAIRTLGLPNVTPLRGRIEELEPRPCAIALAQAVGPAADVLSDIRPWARPGGLLGIPASEGAKPPQRGRELGVLREVRYQVPLGGASRELWLVRTPS